MAVSTAEGKVEAVVDGGGEGERVGEEHAHGVLTVGVFYLVITLVRVQGAVLLDVQVFVHFDTSLVSA